MAYTECPADSVVASVSVYEGSREAVRGEVVVAVDWCSCTVCGPRWFTADLAHVAVRLQGGAVLQHAAAESFRARA